MSIIIGRARIRLSTHAAAAAVVLMTSACEWPGITIGAAGADLSLQRLWETNGESVFAYSRISGDGRYLAYSFTGEAAGSADDARRLRVVDLSTREPIFEDFGIDGYWSPDGSRLIYKARRAIGFKVAIWNRETSQLTLDVFPAALGDYYSWGGSPAGETVMTIDGWYLRLTGPVTTAAPQRMPACPGIGRGARPLISRDGLRASVFVGDQLILRNVRDCDGVVFTGLTGAKADWSRDGRYLAFHTATANEAYEVGVYDTRTASYAAVPTPEGSSFFPSWTDDDALVFRHEGRGYRGFMRVDGTVTARTSERPLAGALVPFSQPVAEWQAVLPRRRCVVVLLWTTWGAHSYDALTAFEAARQASTDCAFVTAHDSASAAADVQRAVDAALYGGVMVRAPWTAMRSAGGFNQTPTDILFRDGLLADRILGALGSVELLAWLEPAADRSQDGRPRAAASDEEDEQP
jgi:hypothetical protein